MSSNNTSTKKNLDNGVYTISRPDKSPRAQAPTSAPPRVTAAEYPRVSDAEQDHESVNGRHQS